jgi:hypothetical protein
VIRKFRALANRQSGAEKARHPPKDVSPVETVAATDDGGSVPIVMGAAESEDSTGPNTAAAVAAKAS